MWKYDSDAAEEGGDATAGSLLCARDSLLCGCLICNPHPTPRGPVRDGRRGGRAPASARAAVHPNGDDGEGWVCAGGGVEGRG